MAYTIKDFNGYTKRINFHFDSLDFLPKQIETALVQKQKTVNLKGFRKGKSPLQMIEKIYRPSIEEEVINNFMRNELYEACTKENIKAVGWPAFENKQYKTGESLSFEAKVEFIPEIEIKEISQYSFIQEKIEVKDEELEEIQKYYLKEEAQMVPVEEGSLEKGQFAILNFKGEREDGSFPEEMAGKEYLLEIGSGQLIPGFEDKMIGMKIDEKKVLELTFPVDYHQKDLQGAKVKFHVELLEIKEKKYPEWTDELTQKFGYESVEDFNKKNKEFLENQKKEKSEDKLHEAILKKLIEENPFDLPPAIVFQEKKSLEEKTRKTLEYQGFTEKMVQNYFSKRQEDFLKKAEFQLRSALILNHFVEKFKIEVSDLELEERANEISKMQTLSEENKNQLKYALREEKAFERICREVQITIS